MRLWTLLVGTKPEPPDTTKIEQQIAHEKGRIRQTIQVLASGARVMDNMAGMMRLMAHNERIPNDE